MGQPDVLIQSALSAQSLLTSFPPSGYPDDVPMSPQELLRENLPLVNRIAARLCLRAGVVGADAEDFASHAKLALMENDYEVLRGFEGRSSLATFLTVILQRMLADELMRTIGRWRPSAEARRLGQAAVMIERLVLRDRRPIEDVLPIVRGIDPAMTREGIESILARLPDRSPRPRSVEIESVPSMRLVARDSADDRTLAADARRIAGRAAAVVRDTMRGWKSEDRLLIRLRFGSGLSVADVARILRLPQRPLYRRQEALLDELRKALQGSGVDASSLPDVVAALDDEVDFGLRQAGEQR